MAISACEVKGAAASRCSMGGVRHAWGASAPQ